MEFHTDSARVWKQQASKDGTSVPSANPQHHPPKRRPATTLGRRVVGGDSSLHRDGREGPQAFVWASGPASGRGSTWRLRASQGFSEWSVLVFWKGRIEQCQAGRKADRVDRVGTAEGD